jgi:hypothetical protein
LPDPLDPKQMSYLAINSPDRTVEELKTIMLNLHPEGVFVQDGDATEIPKINDVVLASSEKIQGRFILTKKSGAMAKKNGGYDPSTDSRIFAGLDTSKVRQSYGKNHGTPLPDVPNLFLKNSGVNWDCLDSDLKSKLKQLAIQTGQNLTVTEGVRDKAQSKRAGSNHDTSQHPWGQAVDIRSADKKLPELTEIKKVAENLGLAIPYKLKHGTFEHFHIENPTKKSKWADSGCSAREIAYRKDPDNIDPATGKRITKTKKA